MVRKYKMVHKHLVSNYKATGHKNLSGDYDWEPVTWTQCWCGMKHSNRITPQSFWEREWEEKNYKRTAGVLLWKQNPDNGKIKYFIIQSYGHLYGIPKGCIEDGESNQESAIREFYEETGTNITTLFSKVFEIRKYIGTKSMYSTFVIQVPWEMEIKTYPKCDNEITSFGFVDKENINKFRLNRITKETLKVFEQRNFDVKK